MQTLKISRLTKFSQSKNTFMKELEGEAVLLNLQNNQYYRLDQESLRMFQVMITSRDLGAAFDSLLGEYMVSPEQLWEDLVSFVIELQNNGIIVTFNE
jgi:hypothetical protein